MGMWSGMTGAQNLRHALHNRKLAGNDLFLKPRAPEPQPCTTASKTHTHRQERERETERQTKREGESEREGERETYIYIYTHTHTHALIYIYIYISYYSKLEIPRASSLTRGSQVIRSIATKEKARVTIIP